MNGNRRLIVLGLDAFDPRLAIELAAEGRLPAIGRLLETAARAQTKNPYGLVVGSLWPSLFTGKQAAQLPFYCWDEIAPGTYEHRRASPRELGTPPFWRAISGDGRRVAVLDVPHDRVLGPLNGIEVSEWGCHDRHFGLRSWPEELAPELERRFGLHPVFGIDAYVEGDFAPDDWFAREAELRTVEEDRALTEALVAGVAAKERISLDLLARERWDLFLSVFGESHAAGHHLWHHRDPSHPRHDPEAAEALQDPLGRIYQRLDSAVATHLEAAGPDAIFLLLLSHGMGAHHDGTHLLEEVLRRLDRVNRGGLEGGGAVQLAKRAYLAMPAPLRRAAMGPAAAATRRVAQRRELTAWWAAEGLDREDWVTQRYFLSPNHTVYGGVRVNLEGREPAGVVAPAKLDAVCAQLSEDLRALVNVATGEPVVNEVRRTDQVYDRAELDALPDLFIDWNRSAPIETVWSPKTGLIHGPYDLWRTGDHRLDGLLLASGPGIAPGKKPPLEIVDLAPSVAAMLGVELEEVDGSPVSWLNGTGKAPLPR